MTNYEKNNPRQNEIINPQISHIFLFAIQRSICTSIQHLVSRAPYQSDYPMFITRTGRRFDPKTARTLIHRIGKRAGIANGTPHRFRHTFAIMYLRNGGDVFTLRRLLGHSSLRTVQKHLSLATNDIINPILITAVRWPDGMHYTNRPNKTEPWGTGKSAHI